MALHSDSGPVGPQEMKEGELFLQFPLNNSGCLEADTVVSWWEGQKKDMYIQSNTLSEEGTDELKRFGEQIAYQAEKSIALAGLQYPDSRHGTLTSLGHVSDSRRKPCVDALLMLKIMDSLTVTLGIDSGPSPVHLTNWNTHKDLSSILTTPKALGHWGFLVQQAQQWRTRSEQATSNEVTMNIPNMSVEEERLWCDVLSLQEQCRQEKRASWAKIVQCFERVAWELRCQIWEKEEDWSMDKGYLNRLRQLAKARGLEGPKWEEIEAMVKSLTKGQRLAASAKRQLAATFCISPLLLLRGVASGPPLFESLVYATRVDVASKPQLLVELEQALIQVVFGAAAGLFRVEVPLKNVLEQYTHIMEENPLPEVDYHWFKLSLGIAARIGEVGSSRIDESDAGHNDGTTIHPSPQPGPTIQSGDSTTLEDPMPPNTHDSSEEQVTERYSLRRNTGVGTYREDDLEIDAAGGDPRPDRVHAGAEGSKSGKWQPRGIYLTGSQKTELRKVLREGHVTQNLYHELLLNAGPVDFPKARPNIDLADQTVQSPSRPSNTRVAPIGETQRYKEPLRWGGWSMQKQQTVNYNVRVSEVAYEVESRMLQSLMAAVRVRDDGSPLWLYSNPSRESQIVQLHNPSHIELSNSSHLLRERCVFVTRDENFPKLDFSLESLATLVDVDIPRQIQDQVVRDTFEVPEADNNDWDSTSSNDDSGTEDSKVHQIEAPLSSLIVEADKGAHGRILNAVALPMPYTTYSVPGFQDLASHAWAWIQTKDLPEELVSSDFPASALSWGLVSHAGSTSFPHIDANGVLTAVHVLGGRKHWFVLRRKDKREITMYDLVEHYRENQAVDPQVWDVEVVVLEPGSQFFMRPNCLHYVISDRHSIAYGQHFYSSDSMRNTVVGWVHARFFGCLVTNAEHMDMRCLLVRMMCVWSRKICKGQKGKHIPHVDSRDGFLDLVAVGNLLIYGHALALPGDSDKLEVKLGVAAYGALMKWLDHTFVLEDLSNSDHQFTAAREVIRNSQETFRRVPRSHRFTEQQLRGDVCQAFMEAFRENLDIDGEGTMLEGETDRPLLLWNPEFEICLWKHIPNDVTVDLGRENLPPSQEDREDWGRDIHVDYNPDEVFTVGDCDQIKARSLNRDEWRAAQKRKLGEMVNRRAKKRRGDI